MHFFFKYNISDTEIDQIKRFYNSLDLVTIEQYPKWNEVIEDYSSKVCYFLAKENEETVCFAQIKEIGIKSIHFTAQIEFGPIFKDADFLIKSMEKIHRYYKRKGFTYLFIQLAIPTGAISDYIECKLNQLLKIRYIFDRQNKTSILVDLKPQEEEIFRNFSKGHKSAVKKAIREGIITKEVDSIDEVSALSEIYIKMCQSRKLSINIEKTKRQFKNIFIFLKEERKGIMLIVKDRLGTVIGGLIAVFEGNRVRYYKGTSDPERKNIPILHLAFWEVIKRAKREGFKYFDLWGYNHYVDDKDQIFYLNRFKKGFGGKYIFYPKIMHIDLKPFGYFIYKGSELLKNTLRLFIKR